MYIEVQVQHDVRLFTDMTDEQGSVSYELVAMADIAVV